MLLTVVHCDYDDLLRLQLQSFFAVTVAAEILTCIIVHLLVIYLRPVMTYNFIMWV